MARRPIGQRRLDVKQLGCDAYVASPHKWLLAPKGTGILYIRRDVQPRFWVTLASGGFDDDETGAFRFMHYGTGSVPVVRRAAGGAAVHRRHRHRSHRAVGPDARQPPARRARADPARAACLARRSPARVGDHDVRRQRRAPGAQLQDALWAKKIRVRAQGQTVDRPVRLSAHLYVSPADIDRVLDVVAALKP